MQKCRDLGKERNITREKKKKNHFKDGKKYGTPLNPEKWGNPEKWENFGLKKHKDLVMGDSQSILLGPI